MRSSRSSMRVIMLQYVPFETTGKRCSRGSIDHIAFKPWLLFDEIDPPFPHGESRCCKPVSFVHVGTNDGQTHDILERSIRVMWIVDMLPANCGSRRGNTLIRDRQDFHNFFALERVTDTDAPGLTIFISRNLDVTTGIDVEIAKSSFFQHMCGLQDCPAFDYPRRINHTVMLNVEIPPRFLSGLLAQCQDRFHLIAILFFTKLA